MTVKAAKETLGFQTEVKQILHLVVHSLYSNKEIFLRELISNASDACDKLRFAALENNALYEDDPELKIRVDFNADKHTITISDNGIGMSRDDVIEHLGTIAKSGTKEFLSQLTGEQAKDSHLIGQFGVGFYSAFIIADKVTVKSRRVGLSADEGVSWTSDGTGEYTVETIKRTQRGTEVTLHLKKDEDEFLDAWRLRGIITKYSDHICWPIIMQKEVVEEPEESEEAEKKAEEKTVTYEDEIVNRATALWTLSKSDITKDEYKELYKHISHDFEDPLLWSHNHVEGKHDYISLLYIPSRAPFDLWQQEAKHGLKLFIKRVFVMDKAEAFLPRYLRFVKGIIDSSDLPLNVSREILQDNKLVDSIRMACTKRILTVLEKLSEKSPEKYAQFWKEFGLVLKEGPMEDFENKERLSKLMRFSSTHDDVETPAVSLSDYVSRMNEGQEKIFYITAESFNAAKSSPHLEVFRKKGIEVLLLSDRIDEWLMSHIGDFDGKHLQSITKGELDLGEETEEEKEQEKQAEEKFSGLLKQVKDVLGDNIKEARLTNRLTTSPACVVADTHDMGREMQRILEAAGQSVPMSKPIFELNADHPLLAKLNQETDDERFNEWVHILYDQALLAEGARLEDPAQFVQRLNKMLLTLSQ